MAARQIMKISEPARGELRVGGEIVAYDLKPGEVAAEEIPPAALERLMRRGVAVNVERKGGADRE